jgi:hypothetical protein
MKTWVLSAAVAGLVGGVGAAAQTSITDPPGGLSAPPVGLSSPPSGLSAPPSGLSAPSTGLSASSGGLSAPASGLSDPGLPGIATPTQPTLSAPAAAPLIPFPLIDALGSPLGSASNSASAGATIGTSLLGSPTLATTPARSPLDDGPIFVGRQLGGLLSGPSSGVSGGLLDSLLVPTDPFALDTLPMPGVSVASGATFSGGGATFDEFCRPQDFTCD